MKQIGLGKYVSVKEQFARSSLKLVVIMGFSEDA